jgi:hypothetical protein
MYFLKTAHGISEVIYKVTKQYLLLGTGQGSGALPAIWLTIVVCLLSTLMTMAPMAMCFMDPWGNIVDEQNADSYVDDTSLGCNDAHLPMQICYRELIRYGQVSAQIWECILYSSGGALELKKCFWYLNVLAMGTRTTTTCPKYIAAQHHCSNVQEGSCIQSDTMGGSLGCLENSWCTSCSRW